MDFIVTGDRDGSRLGSHTLRRWLTEVEDWPPEVADRQALESARAEFDSRHCILLRNFVEPGLARAVLEALNRATFVDYSHEGIGTELCARPGLVARILLGAARSGRPIRGETSHVGTPRAHRPYAGGSGDAD